VIAFTAAKLSVEKSLHIWLYVLKMRLLELKLTLDLPLDPITKL
jgi:hypothetical protein